MYSRLYRFPPLTRDELGAIYLANPSPAVRMLLREIARLQRFPVRLDDYFKAMQRSRHASRNVEAERILDELRTQ